MQKYFIQYHNLNVLTVMKKRKHLFKLTIAWQLIKAYLATHRIGAPIDGDRRSLSRQLASTSRSRHDSAATGDRPTIRSTTRHIASTSSYRLLRFLSFISTHSIHLLFCYTVFISESTFSLLCSRSALIFIKGILTIRQQNFSQGCAKYRYMSVVMSSCNFCL